MCTCMYTTVVAQACSHLRARKTFPVLRNQQLSSWKPRRDLSPASTCLHANGHTEARAVCSSCAVRKVNKPPAWWRRARVCVRGVCTLCFMYIHLYVHAVHTVCFHFFVYNALQWITLQKFHPCMHMSEDIDWHTRLTKKESNMERLIHW